MKIFNWDLQVAFTLTKKFKEMILPSKKFRDYNPN